MSSTLKELVIKELLTCGVCYHTFKDPKCLPCSHTFCDSCLRYLYQQLSASSGYSLLICPVCRERIVGESYEDLGIKSNLHVRSLLETIESYPNHEQFLELYRIHQGLQLDLTRVLAISEKNQSQHLRTHNHDLRTRVLDLQQQLQTAEHEIHIKDERFQQEENQNQHLRTRNHVLRTRVLDLQQQLKTAEHEIHIKDKGLREEENQNQRLRIRNQELKTRLLDLQQQLKVEVDDAPPLNREGINQYNGSKKETVQLVVTEMTQHLRRLEAQRNGLNAEICRLRNELQKKA